VSNIFGYPLFRQAELCRNMCRISSEFRLLRKISHPLGLHTRLKACVYTEKIQMTREIYLFHKGSLTHSSTVLLLSSRQNSYIIHVIWSPKKLNPRKKSGGTIALPPPFICGFVHIFQSLKCDASHLPPLAYPRAIRHFRPTFEHLRRPWARGS